VSSPDHLAYNSLLRKCFQIILFLKPCLLPLSSQVDHLYVCWCVCVSEFESEPVSVSVPVCVPWLVCLAKLGDTVCLLQVCSPLMMYTRSRSLSRLTRKVAHREASMMWQKMDGGTL
jgi:hypothetical protein